MSEDSTLTVEEDSGFRVVFIDRSSDRLESVILWVLRRFRPRLKLAQVLAWSSSPEDEGAEQ